MKYETKRKKSLKNIKYNKKQNIKEKKTCKFFFPIPLIFKLQKEVLKLNDICMSWKPPKKLTQRRILKTRKIEVLKMLVFLKRNYLGKDLIFLYLLA